MVKKISLLSSLTALSSIMYIVESFIPFPLVFGKWGFSNSVVLLLAVEMGLKEASLVAIAKSIVGSLMVGKFLSLQFFMGFFGALSASIVESYMSRFRKFGYLGLSVLGSISNNFTQFLIASFFIKSSLIFALFPLMIVFGIISASANAYIAKKLGGIIVETDLGVLFTKKKRTPFKTGNTV